jgi:phage N-6-adenine-methyltransferase
VRSNARQEIVPFDPARYRLSEAALNFTIEEAKRIKDWPTLEAAVDDKILEQVKFVAWWDANVRDGGRPSEKRPATAGGLPMRDAEKLTGITNQRKSALRTQLGNPEAYRKHLLGAAYLAAYLEMPAVRGTQGTGENEWFTPVEYIRLAREVLGEIDLDPASHQLAQLVVQAARFFTEEQNGLAHEWHGRVWLNPPYAQPAIGHFVDKLCEERNARRVEAAIMLTHNYTDTEWFHSAIEIADLVCFTRGRVRFCKPDGTLAAPTQGQAFFYFGSKMDKFAATFRQVGFIVRPQ